MGAIGFVPAFFVYQVGPGPDVGSYSTAFGAIADAVGLTGSVGLFAGPFEFKLEEKQRPDPESGKCSLLGIWQPRPLSVPGCCYAGGIGARIVTIRIRI